MNPLKKVVKSILATFYKRNLLNAVKSGKSVKVVIGASTIAQSGWYPTEIEFLNIFKDEDWGKFFKSDSVDAMVAEHVFEHLTENEGMSAFKLIYKYLKPGGHIRIAVPDGMNPNQNYINFVKPGGTGEGADDHKILYTYKTLKKNLEKCGFNVRLLEYFDESGDFKRNSWSKEDGFVRRSAEFDVRNQDGKLRYLSLIVDGIKV